MLSCLSRQLPSNVKQRQLRMPENARTLFPRNQRFCARCPASDTHSLPKKQSFSFSFLSFYFMLRADIIDVFLQQIYLFHLSKHKDFVYRYTRQKNQKMHYSPEQKKKLD
jgi:hypothetical protein